MLHLGMFSSSIPALPCEKTRVTFCESHECAHKQVPSESPMRQVVCAALTFYDPKHSCQVSIFAEDWKGGVSINSFIN